ncbi:MAG: UbiX family flavin prenyltransferase [Candidatus Aenigmarchaeota archaeon]|nr:UbiX family flavin prenyltransferase [Candidatus Aenigmarchaeota archaeon]
MQKRIIVGISGASCICLGVRMLETLRKAGAETHMVVTETAKRVLKEETGLSYGEAEKLADKSYDSHDFFAAIASGSFRTDGMVVVPCSMKTLGGIASGNSSNLLLRAADVMLKERRRLVLVVRETPLNLIHIRNMETAALAGAVILPPMPACYTKPETIDDLVTHVLGKVCDQFGIDIGYKRWE